MLRGFYALEQTRHRVPDPVRHRREQHRGGAAAGPRGHRRADLARPGARLRRVLPRRAPALSSAVLARRLGGLGCPAGWCGFLVRLVGGRAALDRRGGVRRGAAAARRPGRRPAAWSSRCCGRSRSPASTSCCSCVAGRGWSRLTRGHRRAGHRWPRRFLRRAAGLTPPTMTRTSSTRGRTVHQSARTGRPARRPVPPGRPAHRERERPLLARPRPGAGPARRPALHRRGRRAGRRPDRGRPASRPPCSTGASCASSTPTARDGIALRRQRVGLRHLARHPGRHRGSAAAAPGRLDRLRGRRRRWPSPTSSGSPTAGWSPRTS